MNTSTNNNYDEDIDDIMVSIMQTHKSPEKEQPKPVHKPKQPNAKPRRHLLKSFRRNTSKPKQPQQPVETKQQIKPVTPVMNIAPSIDKPVAPVTSKKAKKPKETKKSIGIGYKKLLLGFGVFILIGTLGAASVWGSYNLLQPKSPFTNSAAKDMGFSLYFPTDLPNGYKIELNSVKRAEDNPVILLGISNDNNQRITISQQKQPDGLNFDSLQKLLTDTRQVQTRFGTVSIGKSNGDTEIANILTEDTWILVSAPKDSVSSQDFDNLVKSFRQ